MVSITRKIEFDAGHRIPDHKSKCRNMHGHRYVLEARFVGPISQEDAGSDNGMVADFSDLKSVMMDAVGEPWDHAFIVYENDAAMIAALQALNDAQDGPAHKTVILPVIPTVENLVAVAFIRISEKLQEINKGGVTLVHVRLYETPNCWSDCVL